jgi:EpsI family protein
MNALKMNVLKMNYKYLLIGLALFIAAAGGAALKPTKYIADQGPKIDLETMIPKQFGEWMIDSTILPVVPNPQLQEALNKVYNQTLSRTYINNKGERIMLSIAYGGDQSDNLQIHLPEGCYSGQGFAVSGKIKGILATAFGRIPVARLVASMPGRNEPITYWIVVGSQVALDSWEMKKAKLSYALKGQIPDGILIRISSITSDAEQGYEIQREFADAMLKAVTPEQLSRLIGLEKRR